ncbi:hypothetical protein QQX09_03865 [Demequina sp. SYSU T00192]|uniref:HEAT repeat-containing protein n=1 Tax=Demequina litoralis TaxID=3051660 RepID=A0ABT8G769_9MICO|nr:hypothetical protein [Demequina sp. SYSU T00192]MDN4474991.1 hypothetical protein [Demequina sp. SYSU T00192]
MGGDEAEGPMRATAPAVGSGAPSDDGFVGRRARRSRAHEYWNARSWSARQQDRRPAPRPAPQPAPIAVAARAEAPFERTAAGLPMRVAPAVAEPDDIDVIPLPRQSGEVPVVTAPAAAVQPVALSAVPEPAAEPWPASLEPVVEDRAPEAAPGAAPADEVDEALDMLVSLAPHLGCLVADGDVEGRLTYARCQSLLARMGRAVSDRRVWRALLELCDKDPDPEVRAAADEALVALETHGTVPKA